MATITLSELITQLVQIDLDDPEAGDRPVVVESIDGGKSFLDRGRGPSSGRVTW